MEIVYILIPLSLLLIAGALWGFFWAVKSGQFDDMDSPALSILEDDDATDPDAAPAAEEPAGERSGK